jgi:hypothetical protein
MLGNLGNIVGTQWEPGKNEKKSFHPPNLKGKKARQLECMLGCMKFVFPKEFVTIFGQG